MISDEAKSPSPYEPTDGDLTSPKDREAIMRQWDYWRKRIVDWAYIIRRLWQWCGKQPPEPGHWRYK